LAVSILMVSPYAGGVIASGKFSFGLFGSAACAKTAELISIAEGARYNQTKHLCYLPPK